MITEQTLRDNKDRLNDLLRRADATNTVDVVLATIAMLLVSTEEYFEMVENANFDTLNKAFDLLEDAGIELD